MTPVFLAIFRQWDFRAKLIFPGSRSGSRGYAGFRLKSGGKTKPSSRILVFFVDWNFDGTAPQNTTWCCCIAPPKWGNFAIASVAFPCILVDCNLRAWGGDPGGLRFQACFSGHTGVIPPETQKILVVFWRSEKCACFGGHFGPRKIPRIFSDTGGFRRGSTENCRIYFPPEWAGKALVLKKEYPPDSRWILKT